MNFRIDMIVVILIDVFTVMFKIIDVISFLNVTRILITLLIITLRLHRKTSGKLY